MNKLLTVVLLMCCCLPLAAKQYTPENIPNVQRIHRDRYISNPDAIISQQAVSTIDSVCADLRRRGVAQIAVVVVEDISSADIFDFGQQLFTSWGVGSSANSNGLGILLVESRHEIRFFTGRGLEGTLPDALCKRIQQQYMLPHFRNNDYSTGLTEGIRAIGGVLDADVATLTALEEKDDDVQTPVLVLIVIIFICGFVVLVAAARAAAAERKCPKCKKKSLVLQSKTILESTPEYDFVEELYVCKLCGAEVRRRKRHYKNNTRGGGGGGPIIIGGGRSFGSGGGFGGGFGGGSFGGGGAGSRW